MHAAPPPSVYLASLLDAPLGRCIVRRKRTTNNPKLKILAQYFAFMEPRPEGEIVVRRTLRMFAQKTGVPASSVVDWLKSENLSQVAKLPYLRCFKALRSIIRERPSKFKAEMDELYDQFVRVGSKVY